MGAYSSLIPRFLPNFLYSMSLAEYAPREVQIDMQVYRGNICFVVVRHFSFGKTSVIFVVVMSYNEIHCLSIAFHSHCV